MSGLRVYPVKGCRGIEVDRAEVHVTGLAASGARDREWMVVDRHRRFVTQREHPRLALVETRIADGRLSLAAPGVGAIELPDASSVGTAHEVIVWQSRVRGFDAGDAAAQWISSFLGAALGIVRFDRSQPRLCNPDYAGDSGAHTMFSDGYPVLVIGQASLDDLNARLRDKSARPLPMNRFRPNVIVTGLDPYDEDHLDTIESDGVTLRLVKPCVRCKVTTTDQASGRVGFEPLPTLSMYRRSDALAGVTFGMNAIVVGGVERALSVGATAHITYRF
ncbi:MAG TPA: MOSC N-terminal beta barrel domain-containing protein [Casimicrobiaceae bacterium]